jgi:small-conductance mechanosensitive channel
VNNFRQVLRIQKAHNVPAIAATPLIGSPAAFDRIWDQTLIWMSAHYLTIVIGALAGTLIAAILYAVRSFGMRLCRSDRNQGHWPRIIGQAIARTSLFFIIMLSAEIVNGYANPPHAIAATVTFLFTVAAAVQAALWVRELVVGIVEHRAGDDDPLSTLGSAVGIIRLLVTVVCFAIAILLILDNLGVNITGLIAGLGVGGIAIGLAAQGIFSDLFAALSIIFDKPFRRGDAIKWDQTSGTVESIGLKTTRVRAVTGEEVVISNANLLNKELHNMARLARRRSILTFGITYQTPPDVCRRIPDMVEEIIKTADKCSFVRCGLTAFSASSLDYELQFDVMTDDALIVFNMRHEVCVSILEAFARADIAFAYPTQTSFTAAPDGTMIMPYRSPQKGG